MVQELVIKTRLKRLKKPILMTIKQLQARMCANTEADDNGYLGPDLSTCAGKRHQEVYGQQRAEPGTELLVAATIFTLKPHCQRRQSRFLNQQVCLQHFHLAHLARCKERQQDLKTGLLHVRPMMREIGSGQLRLISHKRLNQSLLAVQAAERSASPKSKRIPSISCSGTPFGGGPSTGPK
eukprot:jgi/Tetstr1/425729/TSEL_016149.t1